MKTVILLDQTCSVFREITPENVRRDVAPIVERKWANTVKQLLDEGRTIYGGKRKKLKKTKNTKTKNTKTKNTKTKNTKTKNTKTKKNVNKSIYRKLIRKYKINK
jgi:septum formation inhibitor MinC